MTNDDIKDEFIAEALRLAKRPMSDIAGVRKIATDNYPWPISILAHARTLQEYAAFKRELSDAIFEYFQTESIVDQKHLCSFILPQPNPDEELAREIVNGYAPEGWDGYSYPFALATIKRLEALGWKRP